VKGGDGFS